MALAQAVDHLHGIDLDADVASVTALLSTHGVVSQLQRGDVLSLPYAEGSFQLAVSFSVLEHIADYCAALHQIAAALEPGGWFLLGMPAVNRSMAAAFRLIGFKGIGHHHVTTPQALMSAAPAAGFRLLRENHLYFPWRRPFGQRLYHNWLLEKCSI